MTVALRPMTEAEFADWLPASFDAYVAERLRNGDSEDFARLRAAEQQHAYFPDGTPGPRHELFVLDDDGQRVGMVWTGPRPDREDDAEQAWLYEISIDDEHRGRGHARAAMRLIEKRLMASGVRELGLNVFGDNVTARHLYARAGFREVSAQLTKKLIG